MTCSCGCTEPHVIMRRRTFDGIDVHFWSDGAVTDRIGTYVVQGSRGAALADALRANREVAEDVCLHEHREVRGMVLEARKGWYRAFRIRKGMTESQREAILAAQPRTHHWVNGWLIPIPGAVLR